MNEITINVDDYLKPDDIKVCCMEAIKDVLHRKFYNNEEQINRMIVNLSYEFVFKCVSDAIGKDAEKLIVDKVHQLLMDDDSHIRYEMWRKKDIWTKENSPAVDIMHKAIKDNEGLIRKKVCEAIDEFKFDDVKTSIYEGLDSILYEKIFGRGD